MRDRNGKEIKAGQKIKILLPSAYVSGKMPDPVLCNVVLDESNHELIAVSEQFGTFELYYRKESLMEVIEDAPEQVEPGTPFDEQINEYPVPYDEIVGSTKSTCIIHVSTDPEEQLIIFYSWIRQAPANFLRWLLRPVVRKLWPESEF